MQLSILDWIIISFFIIFLVIGIVVSKKSEKDSKSLFLSDRNKPWWLLGVSMVATTFAADTPSFVTGLIREDGGFGKWIWWGFLLTGMLTVFYIPNCGERAESLPSENLLIP